MHAITRLLALACAAALAGCAAHVRTNATYFHGPGVSDRGTIAVMPMDDQQKNSLEFRAVADAVGRKLAQNGYTVIADPVAAKYVYFVTYGIDNGRTVSGAVPLYGQTGGGTAYTTGTFRSPSGSSTTYTGTTTRMPTYGVVGAAPVSATIYKRDLNIDIYRQGATNSPKVLEIRVTSQGSCGNMNSVVFDLVEAVFKTFPGNNGQVMRVDVPATSSC